MGKIYARKEEQITKSELAHMNIARALAGECVVLLENNGTLPLSEKGKIALYGNGARHTVKGGSGSGDVNSRTVVTIEEGMQEAGYLITTKEWLERYDNKREDAKKAHREWIAEEAKKRQVPEFAVEFSHPFLEPSPEVVLASDLEKSDTDTAVYVIARNSGEGADRYCKEGDYLLFQEELDNIKLLAKHYKKCIVVLNVGGVMDISALKEMDGIDAIILMSQLGNIGGHVLCDVLTGAVTPSGKLTDTWAKSYWDYPSSKEFSHNDNNVDDEYYRDGIFVGYRYFDSFGVEPVYPFGYGKSYTQFEVSTQQVTVENAVVTLQVKVTNTGDTYAGKEVVQVYVSAPKGTLVKPYQELKAFAKSKELKPGEEELLTITFLVSDMASYSEACGAWVLERGKYIVRVGNSSKNTKTVAGLMLDDTVKVEEVKNLFARDDWNWEEIVPEAFDVEEETEITIAVSAKDIPSHKATYQGKREVYHTAHKEVLTAADVRKGRCTVEELVAQLSVEELAEICVGTLRQGEDNSVVGNASYLVPGAAGDTTNCLMETRGIKNMILADGPAGLRLTPHFKAKEDGTLIPGGSMFGDKVEPFGEGANDSDVVDYYQYCTAIPIGWALAQSWNYDLLKQAGDIVGEEMEEYHVDLWLAPAMNIHRNPLCGRNFEYYSEDPLVSGKAAAAITLGVQKHPGKGTTIKHYAVNNQEDNRYFTNSHVSERALREIYLKGFEIAIKESKPMSIMTSYNLLNGIHTANSYDLIQAATRDEWGFDGVVMTDWFTSQDMPGLTSEFPAKYPISASTGCIYAGNDLQMPGCRKNVDDIVWAVKEGKALDGYQITLADLQFNAANVIRVAIQMM